MSELRYTSQIDEQVQKASRRGDRQKKARRLNEKVERLLKSVEDLVEEYPDHPFLLLCGSKNGVVSGRMSPWLRDIATQAGNSLKEKMLDRRSDILSSVAPGNDEADEGLSVLFAVDENNISVKFLRTLLPKMLRILQGKKPLWGEPPYGWPIDVPFQDPNKTVDGSKLSSMQIRRVMASLREVHLSKENVIDNVTKEPDNVTKEPVIAVEDEVQNEVEINDPLISAEVIDVDTVDLQSDIGQVMLHGVAVSDLDVESLQPGNFITDTIIDLMGRYFMKVTNTNGRYYVLPSWVSHVLLLNGPISARPLDLNGFSPVQPSVWLRKYGIKMTEYDRIILPVCDMVHWYLAVWTGAEKELLILCSMGSTPDDSPQGLSKFILSEYLKQKIALDKVIIEYPEVARQTNGYDCGLYVISFMYALLQGRCPRTLGECGILSRENLYRTIQAMIKLNKQ